MYSLYEFNVRLWIFVVGGVVDTHQHMTVTLVVVASSSSS